MAALTQTRVRARFAYDPLTGWLTYRVNVSRRSKAGMRAGCNQFKDAAKTIPHARYVGIDGKQYIEARIIWLWVTGVWLPDNIEIDHKNVDPFDNHWANLRLATSSNNNANQRKRKTYNSVATTSQLKGVYWSGGSVSNPWQGQIQWEGKHYYLGLFPTELSAHQAYVIAAKRLHKQFARAA